MDLKIILLLLLALSSFMGSAFIFFKKGNKAFSVTILSLFLMCLGLIFFETFLINYLGHENSHPILVYYSYMFFVLCLALPPTFYMYVLSLVEKGKDIVNLNRIQVFYTPAILLFVINTFSFVSLGNLEAGTDKYDMIINVLRYSNFISLFFIFLLQNVVYTYFSWRFYYSQKVILQGSQSKESNITLNWMKWFIILYTVLIALLYLFQLKPFFPGKMVFRIFTLFYIGTVIYFGSKNYQFILEKIKGQMLDAKKISELKKDLLEYMGKEQPYLNYDVSLNSLAQALGTNSKYLSYLINKEFDSNFSSFINNYRIEKAKKLLSNAENDIYTIETIAEMTGFKSKSAFNTAFKKFTSLTPSKYKLEHS